MFAGKSKANELVGECCSGDHHPLKRRIWEAGDRMQVSYCLPRSGRLLTFWVFGDYSSRQTGERGSA